MPKKRVKQSSKKSQDDSRTFAFLATFLSIVGFVIAILLRRDDKYVMFYAKQSLALFIASVIVGFADKILMFIPIIGWIIILVLNIAIFALWIISWVYALSGKEQELPIIGEYGKKFNF